jgi:hypothetical protein
MKIENILSFLLENWWVLVIIFLILLLFLRPRVEFILTNGKKRIELKLTKN